MSKHLVKEVRAEAHRHGNHVADMLTSYADLLDRIKADEVAVAVACEVVGIVRENDDGKYIDWTVEGSLDALEAGDALYCIDGIEAPDDGFTELFTHPPAQAAQVPEGFEFNLECADAALRKLTAIHPITPPEAACIKAVIVGARALLAAPTAEPVAQGEVVAWRRRHSSGEAAWLGWIYSEAKPKCVASATTQIEPLCRHLAAQPRAVPDPTILYTTEEVVEAQETLRKYNRTLMGEVIDQMVDVLLAAAPSPGESE